MPCAFLRHGTGRPAGRGHNDAIRTGTLRRAPRLIGVAAACAAALPAVARAAQSALEPAADQALAIDSIWRLMLAICGVMYLLVLAGLLAVLWRERRLRARGDAAAPVSERALTRSLVVWTAAIGLGLLVLATASFLVDRRLVPRGDAALNIRVTGKQWWWQVEYLDADPSKHFATANELHLPVGRAAHIELASDDVIHSFWLPNLAGKRDMIPGRVNHIELTPRSTGTYRGPCAEFCGIQHANMALLAIVDDDGGFEAWRAGQLAAAPEPEQDLPRRGRAVFSSHECALCHTIRGTDAGGTVGPDLTHLASRRTLAAGTLPVDAGALAAWLANPQQIKPGTKMPAVALDPEQLNALVAYLLTLH